MTTVGTVFCNAMLNVSVTQYLFVYVATYLFRYFACSGGCVAMVNGQVAA